MQDDAVPIEMENFISVTTLTVHTTSILLDGVSISSSWTSIDSYSVVTLPVTHGWHSLSVLQDSGATFAAYLYGRAKLVGDHYAYGYAAVLGKFTLVQLQCSAIYFSTVTRIYTRNTLDCNQSNYSSRIVFATYLMNLVKPERAPFDPPTPKTPP